MLLLRIFPVYIILFLFSFSCSKRIEESVDYSHLLWYDKPANRWEEALPVGNGRLGAMVFGDPRVEHLQLNEETVWSGEPGNNINVDFQAMLPGIRELIFNNKYSEAQELANSYFPRQAGENNNYGMRYQPVGDVLVEFVGIDDIQDYKRMLDIGKALSTTTFKSNDISYKRETFSSFSDDVIIMQLSASRPGSISCKVSLSSPHEIQELNVNNDRLELHGTSGDYENKEGKVRFTSLVHPILDGGRIRQTDSLLVIENANSVSLYISIGTNFLSYKDISGDPYNKAETILKNALSSNYEEALSSHVEKYTSFYDRVKLDLGLTDSIKNPTDTRLAQFNKGNDPHLISLYFQYGRYLLISSSQPGTQVANLQGIWNNKIGPPWDSKYTININTEMNYWPAEVTNLPELQEPLFSMLKDLSQTGQESASRLYGADGWNVHHNTDLWRISGPVDGAYYGLWPMGGAWLSQNLWQHYLYSGDKEFLNEAYPILRGLARFYIDILQPEPETGWYVVCPSMSPENSHRSRTTIAAGTTMDNQLVFDVFSNVIASEEILEMDDGIADTLNHLLEMMPPMQIGKWGQLQEWMHDWDRQDDKHRHVSHLYGLYPSNQISPYRSMELFEAAKTSLLARGDVSTGWSMGWKVNLWARFLDGDHALKLIKDQLTPSIQADMAEEGGTYPNLFDAHPPFQIDGNFGCTSGIAEMLIQSHDGAIHILPALPGEWRSGNVIGLKARGGFKVDIHWENGKMSQVRIYSELGGNCRIRSYVPLKGKKLRKAEGGNPNPFFRLASIKQPLSHIEESISIPSLGEVFEYDIMTEEGEIFRLVQR